MGKIGWQRRLKPDCPKQNFPPQPNHYRAQESSVTKKGLAFKNRGIIRISIISSLKETLYV